MPVRSGGENLCECVVYWLVAGVGEVNRGIQGLVGAAAFLKMRADLTGKHESMKYMS
jgi:hypothetical protein